MDRVNKIMNHSSYIEAMKKNNSWENDRIYCKHGLEHQLDVARIAYINILEQGLKIEKEYVYAIALLHDVGRFMQYEGKMKHNEASALLAKEILSECDFNEEEILFIVNQIVSHGHETPATKDVMNDLIDRADKLSRNCFQCNGRQTCYWEENDKNKGIIV